jgi:putative peptidyl-prolyl cis-trans isomerase
MMRYFQKCSCVIVCILCATSIYAANREVTKKPSVNVSSSSEEVFDRVAAVVNGNPITVNEVDERLAIYKKSRNMEKLRDRNRVLDQFINEKIVEYVATENSIQITETAVDNKIEQMMKQYKITDRAMFVKRMEAEHGMPFNLFRIMIWKEELMDQVMTYAIEFSPPSAKEVREWYEKNKNQPYFLQMNFKHILIRTRNDSLEEQKIVTDKLKDIQRRLLAGASFEETARRESQDPGVAENGGEYGWRFLGELDPILADQMYQQYRPGIMTIMRSSYGYHLIKISGKRVAPFNEIEPRIYGILGQQRRAGQFQKWLEKMRNTSEVKIYLEGYVREKSDGKNAGSVR